ncbi:putative prenylcysteine oxidase 1 precursor protein [Rosellinia necatrix]|uniref:Putative prenylcysteine oxidase 1 protein n=1 Tax=Rosellinia necatrix TaxID=77044 RepID=A0A1S7UJW4_ROSNE|nr:putative prenylcysteine oxidase 1 precursor protein [Rosellinia necatrix]
MADNYWSEHSKSPPPSYSAYDSAACSGGDAPPPYNLNPAAAPGRNERTPLIVLRPPPRINVSIRIERYQGKRAILLTFGALSFGVFVIWLLVSSPFLGSRTRTLPAPLPLYNVAIVGAGPAGIAAAQYLCSSPTARGVRFNITIFEAKPVIGGMLSLHDANGKHVLPNDDPMQSHITAEDIVGTALMWQNSLFTQDSENMLGDSIHFDELVTNRVGFYKNRNNIASAVRPYSKSPVTTWCWLLWKYGASYLRAATFNADADLRKRMLQAPLTTDAEDIFKSLGALEHLQEWAETLLKKSGISDRYATEILEPQARRAFGQGLGHITGFAVMLAASQEDSASAYMGGHLIERLERIVRRLCVRVRTSTRVVGINHDSQGGRWSVQYASTTGEGDISTEVFDKVILTAVDMRIRLESRNGSVYNLSSFQEPGLDEGMDGPEDDYFVPAHITFFTTKTKLTTWGAHDQVLFLDGSSGVQEIELVRETTSHGGTQYLYRVLSQSSVLEYLRNNYGLLWSYETRIMNWHPIRSPLFRMPTFEWPLARGLWWSSVIQQAWSTVDLNWLAGKAVADDLIKEVLAGEQGQRVI